MKHILSTSISLKRISLLLTLLGLSARISSAQIETCAVTGTVYQANGQPFAGAQIVVQKVRKANLLLRVTPQIFLTDTQGHFSILLPRGSVAWIEAPIDGFYLKGGVPVQIPDAGSAELTTLEPLFKYPEQVPVGVPPAGTLGIRDDGSPLGLFDTVDFKAGFDLTNNNGVIEIVGNPIQALGYTPANNGASFITTVAESNLGNEKLLGDVIGKGALAARPSAGISGRLYYVTDSGSERWTRDNGANWEDAPIHWNQILGKPSTFAPSAHTHAAGDIVSGVIDVARLGTGTPDSSKFLRGDGAWATPIGFADPMTTRGDLIYRNPSNVTARLALGASGTYPRSNGLDLEYATISSGDLPTGIDAAKLADGSVSNSEFQSLNGVTSAIQTQLDAKVPTSRTISAGDGLSGGGDFSADRTLSVVADSTTQRVEVLNNGSLVGTRKSVNFIPGTNVSYSISDNVGSNRVDVTINASGGSGGDSVSVNGTAATDANFVDTAATGTVPSITWSLNTAPNPDQISISAIGAASATQAGILTTGAQTIAGFKTFTDRTILATAAPGAAGRRLRVDDTLTAGAALAFISSANQDQVIASGDAVAFHVRVNNTAAAPNAWAENLVIVKDTDNGGASYVIGHETSLSNNTTAFASKTTGSGAVIGIMSSYIHIANGATAAFASTGLGDVTNGFINATRSWEVGLLLDGIQTDGTGIWMDDARSNNGGLAIGLDTSSVASFSTAAVLLGNNQKLAFKDNGGTAREVLNLNSSNRLILGGPSLTGVGGITITKSAQTSGNTFLLDVTQTQPNSSDTGDSAFQLTYNLSANSATNELVTRVLNFGVTNSLTGGGAIQNLRSLNIATNTGSSTTTTNLIHIFLESGTTSGTVTSGYGLYINGIQGSTKWGVYDPSGSNWFLGGQMEFGGLTFANLGSPANGRMVFCTDCNVTSGTNNTCTSGGSGALAVRIGGVWRCFNNQN